MAFAGDLPHVRELWPVRPQVLQVITRGFESRIFNKAAAARFSDWGTPRDFLQVRELWPVTPQVLQVMTRGLVHGRHIAAIFLEFGSWRLVFES